MANVDLLIKNVQVYNTVFKRFYPADVSVLDGRIYHVEQNPRRSLDAAPIPASVLDGRGAYMIPGLIDIHMHIESSMLTPLSFSRHLSQCGVTTIVSEPHEMANVGGVDGILSMMEAGKDAPIDIFYGIPSCVPSTSSHLETTGGIVDFQDMKKLLHHPKVACVGEVMNYRQIIREDNQLEISRFLTFLREQGSPIPVEGHCPMLLGEELSRFIYLGIDSDHTEHSIEELRQRFFQGMYIELQDKMLNHQVLDFIHTNQLYGHFGFVTDDVMADALWEEGHLNAVVKKAIKLGMPPEQAIYHATYTNAVRMNLTDRTMLAPGKLADFILIEDLDEFKIQSTYKRGVCIYDRLAPSFIDTPGDSSTFPESYYHSVHLGNISPDLFTITCDRDKNASVRIIHVADGGTKTTEVQDILRISNKQLMWEESPYLLVSVVERYGKSKEKAAIGMGLAGGDFMKTGAVATTYCHDHHNLLIAGKNKKDMALAANCVIEMNGGIAVVENGMVKARLPLPIGGILSDASVKKVGLALKSIRKALENQGYRHYNPIMSLCTLGLLASPSLKVSDKGLIDVKKSCVTSLIL